MKDRTFSGHKENLTSLLDDLFRNLESFSETLTYNELLDLWREFHEIYINKTDAVFQNFAGRYSSAEQPAAIDKIEAESVIVEVRDMNTGIIFRREVPLDYHENDNGIILSGESVKGEPAEIAFLSGTAAKKITDLTGKGPDKPHAHD